MPPLLTQWSLKWSLCVVGKCTLEDDAHQVYTVHSSLTYRQKLLSSLKTTELHSTLQSTLPGHQSSYAWRCCGESCSLARGTHDLSPTASRLFPRWYSRCNMCPDFFLGCCSGSHPEPGLQVWECSKGHLRAATHHRYMCSSRLICPCSFPQAYSVTPFKWLKFNRSMYLLAGHDCTLG